MGVKGGDVAVVGGDRFFQQLAGPAQALEPPATQLGGAKPQAPPRAQGGVGGKFVEEVDGVALEVAVEVQEPDPLAMADGP